MFPPSPFTVFFLLPASLVSPCIYRLVYEIDLLFPLHLSISDGWYVCSRPLCLDCEKWKQGLANSGNTKSSKETKFKLTEMNNQEIQKELEVRNKELHVAVDTS